MYGPLLTLHSLMRWVALILLVVAAVQAWQAWKGQKPWTPTNKKLSLFSMIAVDIQLLLGIILFLGVSPTIKLAFQNMKMAMKNRGIRFFLVEHTFLMFVAIVLVHVGFAKAKRLEDDNQKHKAVAIYFTAALVAILIAIPWPFISKIARPWFRFSF